MEENYHASPESNDRALVGYSMGSVRSTRIWLDPETRNVFGYYGFFSGADKETFEAEFTVRDDVESLQQAVIMIGGGTTDWNMFNGDLNSASIYRVNEWMDHYSVDHVYSVVGGAHNVTAWTQLFVQFVGNVLWK